MWQDRGVARVARLEEMGSASTHWAQRPMRRATAEILRLENLETVLVRCAFDRTL